MEPRQHEVAPNLDAARAQSASGEYMPANDTERGPESSPERTHSVGDAQAEISQIAIPTLPAPVVATQATPQGDDASGPALAADDDLIEKEWVEKAKSIIAATKDDPYRREREISKLQIEYIRKRYGRVIGNASD
jgi:hypothetical protein